MNFKTTLVLALLLAGVAGYLIISGTGIDPKPQETPKLDKDGVRVSDWKPADIVSLQVEMGGKRLLLEQRDRKWSMQQPVASKADSYEVSGMVSDVLEAKSRTQTDLNTDSLARTGLAEASYRLTLVNQDGKTLKIDLGNRGEIGDTIWGRINDNATKLDVLVASRLVDRLDRSFEEITTSLRERQLVSVMSSEVKQMTITRGDETLRFEKNDADWKLVAPETFACENSEVSDLLYAVTGMRASEFVDAKSQEIKFTGMDRPRATVFLTTQPATRPATQPTGVTATIGRYAGALKEKIYVRTSEVDSVTRVPAGSIDRLAKVTLLELRNRQIVDIDPEKVSRIELTLDKAATTQPTTLPASKQSRVIVRRTESRVMGPALPTSLPATTQAATVPASQPAPSPWIIKGAKDSDADKAKVEAFLKELRPLRADKYIKAGEGPTTKPRAGTLRATITVEAAGAAATTQYVLEVSDVVDAAVLVGQYAGATFECSRGVWSAAEAVLVP